MLSFKCTVHIRSGSQDQEHCSRFCQTGRHAAATPTTVTGARARARPEVARARSSLRPHETWSRQPTWGRRPVVASRRPRRRDGLVGRLPLLRQPGRAADRADHRGLRRRSATTSRRQRPSRPAGGRPRERWVDAATAIRSWALDHPNDYALIYGTPDPGVRGARRHRGLGHPRVPRARRHRPRRDRSTSSTPSRPVRSNHRSSSRSQRCAPRSTSTSTT